MVLAAASTRVARSATRRGQRAAGKLAWPSILDGARCSVTWIHGALTVISVVRRFDGNYPCEVERQVKHFLAIGVKKNPLRRTKPGGMIQGFPGGTL